MDGDPAVESRLDSFSLTFPLPYRVAFIVVVGKKGPPFFCSLQDRELTMDYVDHSRLGMGRQPPLPLRPQNRCALLNPLPRPSLRLASAAPLLDIPARRRPLRDLRLLDRPLLALLAPRPGPRRLL